MYILILLTSNFKMFDKLYLLIFEVILVLRVCNRYYIKRNYCFPQRHLPETVRQLVRNSIGIDSTPYLPMLVRTISIYSTLNDLIFKNIFIVLL